MAVQVELIEWGGWSNCYRLSNGEIELVLVAEVGPRIIRFGFSGGQNLFKEIPEELGGRGEAEFRARGGHRLWSAPENFPRTYASDNHPVEIAVTGTTIEAAAPVEPGSGLRKRLLVRMAGAGNAVSVVHSIENTLPWPIELSAWALTMMAPGGVGISGFPPRGTHPEVLLPTNPLVMWAFSDLSDPRWSFTKKYLILRQDATRSGPTKLGLFNEKTWGAYLLGSDLFIKRAEAKRGVAYPDYGCSYETFANGSTLELETLSPLERLDPGAKLEHTERWTLHHGVTIREWTDAELDRVLLPMI